MPDIFNNIPVARIDNTFLDQLTYLKNQARTIYAGSIGTEQRTWQIPKAFTWDGNLFHISTGPTSIAGAYDRTTPNQLYLRALHKAGGIRLVGDPDDLPIAPVGEGRTADCQVEKIQIDHLA